MKRFLKIVLAILLAVIGLFFLIGALSIKNNAETSWIVFLCIGAASLIASLILFKLQGKSSGTGKFSNNPSPSAESQHAAKAPIVYRETFNIAGVTFNNTDGSSRQQLLRAFDQLEPPFPEYSDYQYELKEEEYKGSPALSIWCNGYQFGYVPSSIVPKLIEPFRKGSCDILRIDVKSFRPASEPDIIYSATAEVAYY